MNYLADTNSLSKDNDAANKVSQRKRIGMNIIIFTFNIDIRRTIV
jgi:hypothetical protein